MRILVTGGTGFLGYHLVKQLCARGDVVRSFALPIRGDHPLLRLPVETHWGDIRDAAAVGRAVAGCDVVYHTAGNVAVWGPGLAAMHAIHVDGTRNVLVAAERGTRVVHTSSIVAVGAGAGGQVFHEESKFNLAGVKIDYVRAKRRAEEVALEAAAGGQDVVVVNPGYLIGPEDFEPSVMGKFCARVWKGRMALAAPGGYNLVDVRDVATGHVLAAERGRAGRRYILGGANMSMPAFMRVLAAAAGLTPRAIPRLPTPVLWLVAAAAEARALKTRREPYPSFQHVRLNRYDWFVTSDRAKAELGYSPRPIEESAREAFDWFAGRERVSLRGLARWWMRPARAA